MPRIPRLTNPSVLEHDHRLPAGEYRTPADQQAARIARCPVCSRHDHTNAEPYGYDKDRQPIPAWWFLCPICRTDDTPVYVHLWTKAGIAWSDNQKAAP